jgi:Uma2 family endonuclease
MAIKAPIASGYAYSDGSVACDPQFKKHPQGIDMLVNPVVIIEPDSIFVTQYLRSAEGWKKRIYDSAEDVVELTGAGMTLTLGEIYQDVTTESVGEEG